METTQSGRRLSYPDDVNSADHLALWNPRRLAWRLCHAGSVRTILREHASAWPTNSFAERSAQFYIDGLAHDFPGRVITPPIPFVNSVSALLSSSLGTPSTQARQVARLVFFSIEGSLITWTST